MAQTLGWSMAEARRASRSWVVRICSDGEVAALEQLEHDGALEEGVVGKVDDAAAARADLANEFVLLDDASLHVSIIARVGVGKIKTTVVIASQRVSAAHEFEWQSMCHHSAASPSNTWIRAMTLGLRVAI